MKTSKPAHSPLRASRRVDLLATNLCDITCLAGVSRIRVRELLGVPRDTLESMNIDYNGNSLSHHL
jgi:hypothetical protein